MTRQSWLRLVRSRPGFAKPALVSVLVFAVVAPQAAANQQLLDHLESHPPAKRVQHEYSEEEVDAIVPRWPNPMLSFLPAQVVPEFDYWRARMKFSGRARRAAMTTSGARAALASIEVTESEPNDTQETANFIDAFGSANDESSEVDVSGEIGAVAPAVIGPFAEDDGSIPLANDSGVTSGTNARASGAIGDGFFGSAGLGTGDFDFFRVAGVAAGETITVDVDTPIPFGDLDSYVVIYDSSGGVVAFNDDDGSSYDSYLEVVAPAPDDYYVSIGGYLSFALSDPFDSSSGTGAGSEGSYEVSIGVDIVDADFFSFDLEAGDILGASVIASGGSLRLYAPNGELRVGSGMDVTFIHPGASPLPGGGDAALSYVIETPGRWSLKLSADPGVYALELRVFTNPLLAGEEGEVQTLFIDFDGAVVDSARFGFPGGLRSLSPLSAFLANWGLSAVDEDAVIDAILATIEENVSEDVRARGENGDFDASGIAGEFDVVILNSRDHPDPAGLPNVSRLVVGGTIAELGIGTIAIAESIDVGNFEAEEIAVVLLDLLSTPAGNPNSLSTFPRASGVTIIEVIGAGVGNITAHEAGHYLGNFHTEQFVTLPTIMDQGGNLAGIVGVGPDGVFGNTDDFDVDFGRDIYVPNEGFSGVEDTLNTVAFGLPTPIFTIQVGIDVKPNNDENPINPSSHGPVQIAILGSEAFDVAEIDVTTLAFGPGGASATSLTIEPRVGDEFDDLVVQVDVDEMGLSEVDTELCFTGELLDGTLIAGCDDLRALPLTCAYGSPVGGEGLFTPEGPPNGDFETGDLSDWELIVEGGGGVAIDDGHFDPPGPGGTVPPFEGSYIAVTFQSGPGQQTLTTEVTLAPDLRAAKLRWADHLENHAGVFADPNQEWRVEVWDSFSNTVLAELFSTDPGDPPLQDWTEREADLSAWIGQTIRLAFTQQDNLFFFNARLDDVRVLVRRRIDIDVDLKPNSTANRVNPMSQGTTGVALLGSGDFDVADVDVLTLEFGRGGAHPFHGLCDPLKLAAHVRDVDNDGGDDLVVHFAVPESGIAFGDEEVCVTGATFGGDEVQGCDRIVTIGGECGLGFELALLLPLLQLLRRRTRRSIHPAVIGTSKIHAL